MKILLLHCDYIRFKPLKKALKNPEDLSEARKQAKEVKEVLVVLTAVEQRDSNSSEFVDKYVKEVLDVANQVKVKNIVLYPYAHLSGNLGSPDKAMKILFEADKKLSELKYKVDRAPFGYYKEFELKVKGHPLSELSREILGDGEVVEGDKDVDYAQLVKEISKTNLDTSKLKENDHRIIGRKMDLWSFNSVAPGMVFWHDKGLFIKNQLIDFWREEHRKEDYKEISTPQIMDSKIWKVSGHWDKYKENNFSTTYEKRPFLAKPMNCPGGMLVYNSSPKSYRDLPLRVGELGVVHRVELSGVLSGLFRLIQFTQDDAHLFCKDDSQVKEEITKLISLIKRFYKVFGLEFDYVGLATRPEKRIGEDSVWDKAENLLESVLKENKMNFKIAKGDGAFYGPKIDFYIKDSLGRSWQTSTIQLDFAMPERFKLEYLGKDNKKHRPIMLHRVIYGSIERFIGVLTEHLNGNFPLWCSPNQVMVMNMNEKVEDNAREVYQEIHDAGFRVEFNDKNESIGKKAREAQVQRFNYLVTIGEKEMAENKIAVRRRDSKDIEEMTVEEFIEKLKSEIVSKKL